jgi:hypothetical protein
MIVGQVQIERARRERRVVIVDLDEHLGVVLGDELEVEGRASAAAAVARLAETVAEIGPIPAHLVEATGRMRAAAALGDAVVESEVPLEPGRYPVAVAVGTFLERVGRRRRAHHIRTVPRSLQERPDAARTTGLIVDALELDRVVRGALGVRALLDRLAHAARTQRGRNDHRLIDVAVTDDGARRILRLAELEQRQLVVGPIDRRDAVLLPDARRPAARHQALFALDVAIVGRARVDRRARLRAP